jgi:hypothetical protein
MLAANSGGGPGEYQPAELSLFGQLGFLAQFTDESGIGRICIGYLARDSSPLERFVCIHFAINLNLGRIIERASRKALSVANPFDTPSNGRPAVWAELIVYFLAAFAQASEGFDRPCELFYGFVLDRQRNPVRAARSLFAGIAMTNPNEKWALKGKSNRAA